MNRLVKVEVNQNRFDALADFVFNLGWASLPGATLLRLLHAGTFEEAAEEFLPVKQSGRQCGEGLTRRRHAEKELFQRAGSLD